MKEELERLERLSLFYVELRDYCLKNGVSKPQASIRDLSIIMLSNDINEIAKSVIALYKSEVFFGINSLVRIAYEKYYYFKHVLRNRNHALAFYYHIQLKNNYRLQELAEPTNYSKGVAKLANLDLDKLNQEYTKELEKIDKKNIEDLEQEYKSLFNYEIKNLKKHNWYSSSNKINNVKDLAESLGLEYEYYVQYSNLSGEVHSYVKSQNYEILVEADQAFFAIYSDVDNTKKRDQLVFMYVKLNETIVNLIDYYKVPNKFKKEHTRIFNETINPSNLLSFYNKNY